MVNIIAVNESKLDKIINEIWFWISTPLTLSYLFLACSLIFSIVAVFFHGEVLLFIGSLIVAAVLLIVLQIVSFFVIAMTTENEYLYYLSLIIPGLILDYTGMCCLS